MITPAWTMNYSPVGWGLLVIVHYWFYVRGAENLCKLREERVEAKGQIYLNFASPNASIFWYFVILLHSAISITKIVECAGRM
jgi:hypothetical protein